MNGSESDEDAEHKEQDAENIADDPTLLMEKTHKKNWEDQLDGEKPQTGELSSLVIGGVL